MAVDSYASYDPLQEKDEPIAQIAATIKRGESFDTSLKRQNISSDIRLSIIDALRSKLDFKRIKPEDDYTLQRDHKGELESFRYESGPLDVLTIKNSSQGYQVSKDPIELERKKVKITGEISSSLFAAFTDKNEDMRLVYAFADIFASKIDFNTEIQPGDRFCLVVVIMVSGSLHLGEIVAAQGRGMAADAGLNFLSWNWLPLLPIFMVYLISGVAETNRHPFDVVEGETEIVAGHMVEYSGMGFAIFFLAEYASMWLVSILAALMFLGGWLPPIDSALFNWIPGWIWLGLKTFLVVSMFIWIRATFPRFRYDQIMRLGWKIFIPVTLVWLLVIGGWMVSPWNIFK